MNKYIAILLGLLAAAGPINAQQPTWNELSLRPFGALIYNAATFKERNNFQEATANNQFGFGAALTLNIYRPYDLDFALLRWTASADQQWDNTPTYRSASLTANLLSITLRRKFTSPGMFVPWGGVGPDMGFVDSTIPGVDPEADEQDNTHGLLGGHFCGGVDIYPVRNSALALELEARYSVYALNNAFKGDLNGFSFFFGLRWDFWDRPHF